MKNPDIKNSFANTLDELEGGLLSAAHLVRTTEHSIAFVGEIGIGKSTAICRTSGLTVQGGSTSGDPDVLEVGTGRTTICEVQLVQGPEYGLLVDPLSEQELHREVREFAASLKEPAVASQEDDGGSSTIGTPGRDPESN